MQQAADYSKTLERINSVGIGMQILDTLPDEIRAEDLKNKTKAAIAELLVKQIHEATQEMQEKGKNKTQDSKN